jgi:hypothetical protein
VWERVSWVLMQHHIKAVINLDAFNTKTQVEVTDTKQKYLFRYIIHCLSFMILCPRPKMADHTYIKIFLNRINEF